MRLGGLLDRCLESRGILDVDVSEISEITGGMVMLCTERRNMVCLDEDQMYLFYLGVCGRVVGRRT